MAQEPRAIEAQPLIDAARQRATEPARTTEDSGSSGEEDTTSAGEYVAQKVDPYQVTVVHNDYEKSASRNRVRFIAAPEEEGSINKTRSSDRTSAAECDQPFATIGDQPSIVALNRWPLSKAGSTAGPEVLDSPALR